MRVSLRCYTLASCTATLDGAGKGLLSKNYRSDIYQYLKEDMNETWFFFVFKLHVRTIGILLLINVAYIIMEHFHNVIVEGKNFQYRYVIPEDVSLEM